MAKSEKAPVVMEYNEASIKSLDWREHIRLRPGMYIGKLGDGSSKDDGIYVLVKEVVDKFSLNKPFHKCFLIDCKSHTYSSPLYEKL